MSKPTFFDLLPFQVVQLLIKFCKSLPERYRALLEYWEERRKQKIEDDEDDEDDDGVEGMIYLTIRPVAIEGEGSNCFSVIQLVGQKMQ